MPYQALMVKSLRQGSQSKPLIQARLPERLWHQWNHGTGGGTNEGMQELSSDP